MPTVVLVECMCCDQQIALQIMYLGELGWCIGYDCEMRYIYKSGYKTREDARQALDDGTWRG